jgi:autotransporter translocation and assembly factor TamB
VLEENSVTTLVPEKGQLTSDARGGMRRRVVVALVLFCALLVILHRPVLLYLARAIAVHYAAKENLKLSLRLEGSVFTNLTARNVHVVPLRASGVESIDVDLAHVDYSLFGLMRHGMSQFLRGVEVHSARIVLNPAKAPPQIHSKKQARTKPELPAVFPEWARLSDATLIVRDSPRDFVIEHVDLDLNPRRSSELRIEKLQLPTEQSWTNITAQTSYANKNLILRGLTLNDQDKIGLLNIDASHINAKQLGIRLEATIGGGRVSGSAALSETRSSLNAKIHLDAAKVAADAFNKYAALPDGFVRGDIEQVVIDGSGLFDAPRTWEGSAAARINNLHSGKVELDRCALEASAHGGVATLKSADIIQGKNEFHLRGSAELPNEVQGFGRSRATLELAATAQDLHQLSAASGQEVSGSARLNGKIEIADAKLEANADLMAGSVVFPDGRIEKLSARLKASKTMARAAADTAATTTAKRPWFANLRSEIVLDMSNIRFREYAIDSVNGALRGANDVLKIERLSVDRKENKLTIDGRYNLPEDLGKAASQPAQLDVSLNAKEVGDYWAGDSRDKVSGPLQLAGQLDWKDTKANGQLSVFGANLKMRDLVFKQLNAHCAVVSNVIYANDLSANLNEQDFVSASGVVDLRAPYHYTGKISANVSDLSKLKPLLRASGNENELAGSLVINWSGSGDAAKLKNAGTLKLALEKARYGNAQSLQANVDATYSPDGLDIPTVFLRSDQMDFQAIVQAKGDTLEITKIQLDQGTARYASGYISVPFVWKNLGTDAPVCPRSGKVMVNFQSESIDIKKLFEDVGMKPAAAGTLNVKLDAQGTLADLNARLDLEMRDLRSERLAKLEPATVNLSAQSQHNQLTVSGRLQQANIQPMELTANLPFDIATIARDGKLPDKTPVNAKLRLPRSSVNFLRQFAPAIQQLDGDVALDVDVNGTIAHPLLKGTGDMTVNVARASDPTLPALQNFKARLNFANDALTIEQFGGELSGGRFTVSGRVTFPKLTTPNLDLQLKADSVLVARNDTLTARADADIKFVGPLNSASVTGNVALTNSQFLKNLDLIPIGLPGRPAPQPPASRPEFSFPDPPLRDWKFDVAIKTKDPFLIRGNLANGGAICDLHLIGTGLHPGLQGSVRLQNVEATLPFSRLEIAYGFLYFDPSDSLNPKLDLHGTSVIRDYTIHVYIYGHSLAPEAVFNSEPPLPQEEIISLLATGTTREELTGNNNVLAGRAAMLLVQQVYRKVFKKGQATQSNSVFDRLDLDVGTVDPRTGQQQAIARFKINDQFVVVGDLGVGGDYRGMLKYLIRFH